MGTASARQGACSKLSPARDGFYGPINKIRDFSR